VGIIKPTTIIAIETLKQYISSMRSQNKVSKMIKYQSKKQCNMGMIIMKDAKKKYNIGKVLR